MFKSMIEYYKPLTISLQTMAGHKSGALFGVSFTSAITIEAVMSAFKLNFLGVSIGVLAMTALFILIDWATGSAAARKRAKEAEEEGNLEEYEKNRLKSSKVTFTIFKFISLYLWLILTHTMMRAAINQGFMVEGAEHESLFGVASILRIITIIPIALFGFREFISIGENIEKLYGKKPYLFELGEKIFDILQFSFLDKFKKAMSKDIKIDTTIPPTGDGKIPDEK
jgi:hypothetical protein